MRDALLLVIVLGLLPFILWRPPWGILTWSWLGYMNPHRLAWGVAYNFPFSQLVALCTLIGLVFYTDRRRIPLTALTGVLGVFAFWFTLSTVFSIYPEDAWQEWDRTIKIFLFTFLTIVLMQQERLLKTLVWIIACSFAFFGVKGGLFSFLTSGDFRVWGPPGSFIEDNNALALALMMAVPLMRFCQLHTSSKLGRYAWLAVMGLTGLSILTSHSRGALVGMILTLVFAWWKSKRKIVGVLLVLPLIPLALSFMPEHWFDRMQTITEYQQDSSAMGRINAWWFAFNLALDRPFFGGGFQVFSPELFLSYAPEPENFHDSHSIYFEVLAEQGFFGLGLFLALGYLALKESSRMARLDLGADHAWLPQLAGLLHLSFIAYAVTGAFLGLAYFDLYYQLIAIVVLLKIMAAKVSMRSTLLAEHDVLGEPAIDAPDSGKDAIYRSVPG
jgi:probable O-glycosylation ligase (exosortase A-associated)